MYHEVVACPTESNMATHLELNTPLAPPLQLRRFSVEQYHQLGELGVLTSEDKVELLEGWIVEKRNQRPIHGFIVRLLHEFFLRELPVGWCQRVLDYQRRQQKHRTIFVRHGATGRSTRSITLSC